MTRCGITSPQIEGSCFQEAVVLENNAELGTGRKNGIKVNSIPFSLVTDCPRYVSSPIFFSKSSFSALFSFS